MSWGRKEEEEEEEEEEFNQRSSGASALTRTNFELVP